MDFASVSITMSPADLVGPMLDDDDLATLRAFCALDHEEPLVVCGHIVIPARDRGLNEIRGIEEHSRALYGKRGQSMGGGIVSYRAGGKQRIGVTAGMKSPIWPGGSSASEIVIYGVDN